MKRAIVASLAVLALPVAAADAQVDCATMELRLGSNFNGAG